MISVITPTIYEDRLKIVKDSLDNQLFTDFEWLVGSPFKPGGIWVKDNYKGGFWSLNRTYNALVRASKGELIVSWQDNVWIPPDGLQKFWIAYQETKSIVSGVGDQYKKLDEYGKPIIKIWDDPRKTDKYGSFYECVWNDAEFNWCAIPKKAFYDCGGFDEELDFRGYGGDQLQLCERLNDLGWKFYLDQTNESFTLRHGRITGWDKNHVLQNGEYDKRKEELRGVWPKLNYLK
jgi:hypothetical protein